ncbi:MAG TPA: fumarylacetoacetase [Telluria sp.]
MLNETHDPALRSWIASANLPGCDFPIQNLPFAIFRRQGSDEAWRAGIAIGDQVLDLAATAASGVIDGEAASVLRTATDDTLNVLMASGSAALSALRLALSRALREGAPARNALAACLVPQSAAEYRLPARIGDYTDFYTSIHHATNIGKQFRPDAPLLPNYKWVPIGYHGRASSIIVSGKNFHRPVGQLMLPGASAPVLQPSRRLDIELELGAFIGAGNALGESIAIDDAESHVFGFTLLNDWSARDIQGWEYQPLGPFLSKNFATSISPWLVTMEALAPYRVAPPARDAADPQPLPYLDSRHNRESGAFDLGLEVLLQTPRMRERGEAPVRICSTNYRHAYWTLAQMLAHHTVGGCNLQSGDLLGTGTLSGPGPNEAAALIELTVGGKQPIELPDGEQRTWLEDGDTIVLRGWCERPGAVRIGFGACSTTVLPPRGH